MSTKQRDPQLLEISRKLDTLIRLSAFGLVRDIKTQKQQIAFLSDVGFQPKEIADVIGTTSNTVSVALHAIRKDRAAKEKESKQSSGSKQTAQDSQSQSFPEVAESGENQS